ncbi:MAG: recombinase family protein [Lachnospiraceae bacterium]|jgi:site-specific DNA recombinase
MAEKIWNVGAYTRLSRDDGDKAESESIGSQKEIIRDFIQNKKDMVIIKEYVDDGYSGVSFERPGFKQMMEDVKAKKIDCIICKDLSRFARNYIDSGRYLEKIFPFMGVRFIAINDNYDSAGEKSQSDSLIVPFKNLINDAYCKDISMKIRSQLDIKRKMGDFIGAFAVYGYKKDPENKNKLLVDEQAAQVVELIFRLRLQGMSNSGIAEKLNDMGVLSPMEYKRSNGMRYESGFRANEIALWTPVAVLRILTNEVYLGTLIQHKRGTPNYKVKKEIQYSREDWIVIEENHEAIVTKIDFDTVQSLLQRDVRVAPQEESVHLFSGYVHCGDCEHTMVRKAVPSRGKKYYYYVCSTHKAKLGCSSHSFSESKLNKIVLSLVQDHIQQICRLDEVLDYIAALPESQREIFNYDAQLTKLNEEIQRFQDLKLNLYSDMADGVISKEEYMEFRAGYDRKIQARQQSLVQLKEEREQAVESNQRSATWIELFKQYENITELQRSVIVNLIERIIIYDSKHIEVVFRYEDQLHSAMQYVERFSEIIEEVV